MSDVVDLKVKVSVVPDKVGAKKAGEVMGEAAKSGYTKIVESAKTEALSGGALKALSKIKSALGGLKQSFAPSLKKLRVLAGRVSKIFVYRAIRSVLKNIAQSIREGVSNLYQWSRLQTSAFGQKFANSLDRIATSLLLIKDALAAMLAPLVNQLASAVEWLTAKFVSLTESISQFLAALTGSNSYLKAINYNLKFADSVKAVRKELLGFDELNVLNGNGGGASISNYNALFEEAQLPNGGNFAVDLGLTVRDTLFNWDNITPESLASKIVTGLSAVSGAIIGWKLGGLGGALLGMTVGATLGMIISALNFNGDGKISPDELADLIWMGVGGIIGGVLGAKYLGVTGAALGFSIGASLSMLLKNILFKEGMAKVGEETLQSWIWSAILPILGGVLGLALTGGNPVGGMFGITIGTVLTMAIKSIKWTSSLSDKDSLGAITNDIVKAKSLQGDYNAIDNALKSSSNNLKNTLSSTMSEAEKIKIANAIAQVGVFANGGYPDTGSLFIAGEAGPELVANINGRTGVLNEGQLTESMAYANEAVVQAILAGANATVNAIKSQNTTVELDGAVVSRKIYAAMNKENTRKGTSLIQGA